MKGSLLALLVPSLAFADPVTITIIVTPSEPATAREATHGDDEEPPATAPAPAEPGRPNISLGTVFVREDAYAELMTQLVARVTHPISPRVAIAAALGFSHFEGFMTNASFVPLRLGIEGRAGALGLELGSQTTFFREHECVSPSWGGNLSAYGVARVYGQFTDDVALFAEAGAHYVVASRPALCESAGNYFEYGGWLGAGVQWVH